MYSLLNLRVKLQNNFIILLQNIRAPICIYYYKITFLTICCLLISKKLFVLEESFLSCVNTFFLFCEEEASVQLPLLSDCGAAAPALLHPDLKAVILLDD